MDRSSSSTTCRTPAPSCIRISVSARSSSSEIGAPRKRMRRRADQDHLVLEDRLEANRPMAPRSADDAELEPAIGDEVDDGLGVVNLERDAQVRVPLVELAQEDGHDDRGGAGRGADRQLARERAGALGGDLVEHLLLELEQALGAAVEAQPGLGRLHPAAGAVEQLGPEPLLERPHLQGDGRLGDAEPLGRLREAAAFDDRAEGGELSRIHKRSLSQDPVSLPRGSERRCPSSSEPGARR